MDRADGIPNLQAYPLAIKPVALTAKVNQLHKEGEVRLNQRW